MLLCWVSGAICSWEDCSALEGFNLGKRLGMEDVGRYVPLCTGFVHWLYIISGQTLATSAEVTR